MGDHCADHRHHFGNAAGFTRNGARVSRCRRSRGYILARLLANCSWDSIYARHAIRLTVTLTIAVIAQHLLQPVIGNPAVEMMDMMNADIGGKPAQHRRL